MQSMRTNWKSLRHVVPAASPPFRLSCNVYRTKDASASTAAPLLFTHANGYHKELWEPILQHLSPDIAGQEAYAFDCRNHADSAILNKDVIPDKFNWLWYAMDILSTIDHFRLKKPIGVGHSFGASAIIMAELIRPGTFSSIIAVDPTMFPSHIRMSGPIDDHPMAQITLRRKDIWESREDCKTNLLKKPFFQSWDREVLDLHMQYGLVDYTKPDGTTGVTLKTPKFQEAVTFAAEGTVLYEAFERLPELNIPVHFIVGETSTINTPDLVEMKVNLCKFGTVDVVKDAGHLVSQEKPLEVAQLITAFVKKFQASQATKVAAEECPRPKL